MRTKRLTVEIEQARKKLSQLISEAQKGHIVLILQRGRPVVELVAVDAQSEQQRKQEFPTRKELLASTREFAVRVRSYIKDTNSRLEAARAVRLNERRLRSVLEGAPDAVLEVGIDGRILQVNHAAERMFGYARSELIQSSIDQLVPAGLRDLHAQHRASYMQKPHARRMGIGMELTAQKKDGSLFPVDVGLGPYRMDGNLRVIVIVHDMTQRNHVQEAMRRSEEKLRQAEKLEALARMAGGIAHQFNNFLTMVTGYSSLMLSALDSKETLVDCVEKIGRASKRAADLTRQLLAVSRRQMLAPQALDVNAVLSEVLQIIPSLIGHDIEASLTPASEPALIRADPSQIHQIIINLILNARDAMPDGGKLSMRISNVEIQLRDVGENSGLAPGKYVQLTISDTGVGMAREVQSRLFEPFFTTKEFGKGSGLNLAAIYGMVQQCCGSISVDSKPGAGTTFTILLPQALLEEGSVAEENVPSFAVGRGSETILLVEDEETLRALTSEFLESLGYRVLVASDGQEALRTVTQYSQRIDLLLTDVLMPGMSGRELAQQLMPLRPEMKILYISGFIDDVLAREGVKSNESLLEKPFGFEDLAEKIRATLRGNNIAESAQD